MCVTASDRGGKQSVCVRPVLISSRTRGALPGLVSAAGDEWRCPTTTVANAPLTCNEHVSGRSCAQHIQGMFSGEHEVQLMSAPKSSPKIPPPLCSAARNTTAHVCRGQPHVPMLYSQSRSPTARIPHHPALLTAALQHPTRRPHLVLGKQCTQRHVSQ